MFEDVDNHTVYGVHIYGDEQTIDFLQASSLLDPETLEGSLEHDGNGEIPGWQFPWGGWDLRPHSGRIMRIDEGILSDWANLFDPPGTAPSAARLLRPLNREHLIGIAAMSSISVRLGSFEYSWTPCWNEKTDKTTGTIKWDTRRANSLDEVVIQGPIFGIGTPFAKEPNQPCKSNKDYTSIDSLTLPARFIPRTNYQRACDLDVFHSRIPEWNGAPSTEFWRLAWRNMTQSGLERSLTSAVIPPGPTHVHTVHTLALSP